MKRPVRLTYKQLLGLFQQVAVQQAETQKGLIEFQQKTEKGLAELQKAQQKTEKGLAELQKAQQKTEKGLAELQKTLANTNKIVGDLGGKLGDITEQIMTADLVRKFHTIGYVFTKITRNIELADAENDIFAEIDGFLESNTHAMAVEIKVTLKIDDIKKHLERMEKIRRYADIHGDNRKFFSAVAAMIVDTNTRRYASKYGLFVIEPSGEDVKVIPPFSKAAVW